MTSPLVAADVYGQRNPLTTTVTYGATSTDEIWKDGGKDNHHEDIVNEGPVFRDVGYSLAFGVQLVLVAFVGYWNAFTYQDLQDVRNAEYGEEEVPAEDDHSEGIHRFTWHLIVPCMIVAFFVTLITTAVIIPSCPRVMVTACVLGTLVYTAMVAAAMMMSANGAWFVYVMALAILLVTIWYIFVAWKFIPYAAQNLSMAMKAIRSHLGIYVVALMGFVVSVGWTCLWLYVMIGVSLQQYNASKQPQHGRQAQYAGMIYDYDDGFNKHNHDSTTGDSDQVMSSLTLFFLVLSLYWTSNVIMNTLQVTVAGVVGTWCFVDSRGQGCCSDTVFASWYRSLTYSFGSICMGSLLQAIVSTLRYMLQHAREQAQDRNNDSAALCSIIYCILQCIVSLLEDIIEYFNQWAYVFVGIYGYGYLDAGKNVIELFKARGLTTIVSNDLAGFVLNFTNFTVGVITGFFAILLSNMTGQDYFVPDADVTVTKTIGFVTGFIVGLIMSATMTNVIRGAVRTIIVCFADAPSKLQENHPLETERMMNTWVSVFPETNTVFAHPVVDGGSASGASKYEYHNAVVA
mmetsp:Transcript_16569/g.25736  ORF Transcript_16569/g.25736 Transcript_16569/m.25736 type:complete len:572 (-) Transcript_16569:62-1777(-)